MTATNETATMHYYVSRTNGAYYTENDINENVKAWYDDYVDCYEPDPYRPEPPMSFEDYESACWDTLLEVSEEEALSNV